MSLKTLNALQIAVGACVAGILVCFAMSIATAVKHHREENKPVNPATIPTPATATSR